MKIGWIQLNILEIELTDDPEDSVLPHQTNTRYIPLWFQISNIDYIGENEICVSGINYDTEETEDEIFNLINQASYNFIPRNN